MIDQEIASDKFQAYLEAGLPTGISRPMRRVTPQLRPFATGSAVIADAQRLGHIEKQHRKVAALDMETYGLYYAAHEAANGVEHYFSVKCVVDLADSNKDDDLHAYGCLVSARAVERLIRSLLAAESGG